MTIEMLCEKLGIVGLVHYTETEKYIKVRDFLYVKETGEIIKL